jgi:hypothetical protein
VATGLYLMDDGTIMVDYGTRQIPISSAQYRANGYKPQIEKLMNARSRCCKPQSSLSTHSETNDFRLHRQ